MVPHAISAPYIIYTSFLLGQSWHVCRVIDGNAFYFFIFLYWPCSVVRTGPLAWVLQKKKGKYNDGEVFTAFV